MTIFHVFPSVRSSVGSLVGGSVFFFCTVVVFGKEGCFGFCEVFWVILRYLGFLGLLGFGFEGF